MFRKIYARVLYKRENTIPRFTQVEANDIEWDINNGVIKYVELFLNQVKSITDI